MFHDDIITVLSVFMPLFSTNVWNYAQTLLIGAILCDNQRTVTAIWISVSGSAKLPLSLRHKPVRRKTHPPES